MMIIRALLIVAALAYSEYAFAENYLVCSGVTRLEYQPPFAEEQLSESLSMRITGNYVVMSDVGRAEINKNAGMVWVWSKTMGEWHWLYNFDTVSGRLTRNTLAAEVASDGSRKAYRQDTFQCRKAERLIE